MICIMYILDDHIDMDVYLTWSSLTKHGVNRLVEFVNKHIELISTTESTGSDGGSWSRSTAGMAITLPANDERDLLY